MTNKQCYILALEVSRLASAMEHQTLYHNFHEGLISVDEYRQRSCTLREQQAEHIDQIIQYLKVKKE